MGGRRVREAPRRRHAWGRCSRRGWRCTPRGLDTRALRSCTAAPRLSHASCPRGWGGRRLCPEPQVLVLGFGLLWGQTRPSGPTGQHPQRGGPRPWPRGSHCPGARAGSPARASVPLLARPPRACPAPGRSPTDQVSSRASLTWEGKDHPQTPSLSPEQHSEHPVGVGWGPVLLSRGPEQPGCQPGGQGAQRAGGNLPEGPCPRPWLSSVLGHGQAREVGVGRGGALEGLMQMAAPSVRSTAAAPTHVLRLPHGVAEWVSAAGFNYGARRGCSPWGSERSSARGCRGSRGQRMLTPYLQNPVIDFLKNDISI